MAGYLNIPTTKGTPTTYRGVLTVTESYFIALNNLKKINSNTYNTKVYFKTM